MATIIVHLDQQTDQTMRQRAERTGQSLEDLIRSLAERAAAEPDSPSDPARRRELFDAWVQSHQPHPHVANDDRQSIYVGRDG